MSLLAAACFARNHNLGLSCDTASVPTTSPFRRSLCSQYIAFPEETRLPTYLLPGGDILPYRANHLVIHVQLRDPGGARLCVVTTITEFSWSASSPPGRVTKCLTSRVRRNGGNKGTGGPRSHHWLGSKECGGRPASIRRIESMHAGEMSYQGQLCCSASQTGVARGPWRDKSLCK